LFNVRNHIQTGGGLVVHSNSYGIVDQLRAIGFPELLEMLASELEPAWKRVAADDRGA
jgi:hypothetical protein